MPDAVPRTVTVMWTAKPGAEDRIVELLGELVRLTRAEPGCLTFEAHRHPDDPAMFMLYERYRDDAAFQAHLETEYFARLVRGEATDLLESSAAQLWGPVAGT